MADSAAHLANSCATPVKVDFEAAAAASSRVAGMHEAMQATAVRAVSPMALADSQPRTNSVDACTDALTPLSALQRDPELTRGAEGFPGVDEQDRLLLADIETRLANEMRRLALTLQQFALHTKAIRVEIPASAKICKLVAGFFPLVAFQLADAILRCPKGFTFEQDGALYLKELGLEVKDFVREIDLEGRKFLAVAFLDKGGRDVLDGTAHGNKL